MSENPATCQCGLWDYEEYGEFCPSCPSKAPSKELSREKIFDVLDDTWARSEMIAQQVAGCAEGVTGFWHDDLPEEIMLELEGLEEDARNLMRRASTIMKLVNCKM